MLNQNQKLYIKALNSNESFQYRSSTGPSFHQFILTGQVAAAGNIQYLLDPDGKRTSVSDYCYYRLFDECDALTKSPELPGIELSEGCYTEMFRNCTMLTTAAELPAETLKSECYKGMFENCSSLLTAPKLVAERLSYQCYSYMFRGCSMIDSVHMKAEMYGIYNARNHGDPGKNVIYDL